MQNSNKLFKLIPEIGEERGSADSVIDHQFPHIAEKILWLWGEPECMEYLENLINWSPDESRKDRQGFPFAVIIELNIIRRVHHERYPHLNTTYSARKKDPWNVQ